MRDDEQFESYLKQFRPVATEEGLPRHIKGEHDGMIWLTAAAAVLLVGAFVIRLSEHDGTVKHPVIAMEAQDRPTPIPLTISRANLELARSKSVKAALNEIAFRRPVMTVPPGLQSALEVLGKEKTRL